MKIITSLIIVLIVSSCTNHQELTYSEDFNLIYSDDVDKFDLKNNTFTRKYRETDSTITFSISEQEKREIFNILIKSGVTDINVENLGKPCRSVDIPHYTKSLELIDKNNHLKYKWTGNNCH